MRLNGIHHISAITADALGNVDFYTRVLGLRLIAKTVNQDDPSAYHLFYGDEHARPGADLTFFEYPMAARGTSGAGVGHQIVWRVADADALAFWEHRLGREGIEPTRVDGELHFADPEGLGHALAVDTSGDLPLIAEHPEVPAQHALRGFEGVRASSASPHASAAVLERLLGATQRDDGAWELRGGDRGGWIAIDDEAPRHWARQGAGTIHHIAFGTNDDEQPAWRELIERHGLGTSGIVDRHYFHSLYFREPGGILYELATDLPGFTVDGPEEELGTRIILPPWLEPRRAQVEAGLTPIPLTR